MSRHAIKVYVTPLSALMTSYNLGGNRNLKEVRLGGATHQVLKVRLLHKDTDPWRFNAEFSGDALTFKSSKEGALILPDVSSDGWMAVLPINEVDEDNYIIVGSGAIEIKEVPG